MPAAQSGPGPAGPSEESGAPAFGLCAVPLAAAGGPAGLARAVREGDALVAVVHGAPQLTRWRARCAALARQSGLVVVTGGRTAGGNLLLCAPAVATQRVADVTFRASGRQPCGAAVAELGYRGRRFTVAAANFAERDDARARQAGELIAVLAAFPAPRVLCATGLPGHQGEPAYDALAELLGGRLPATVGAETVLTDPGIGLGGRGGELPGGDGAAQFAVQLG